MSERRRWLIVWLLVSLLAAFASVAAQAADALAASWRTLTAPVGERATVVSRIQFGPEQRDAAQGVWLAGFSAEPGGAPTVLALTFARVPAGWLGPLWGLQLQSNAGLLPARLNPQPGSGFLEGSEFILLQSVGPRWGHEYEVRFGYDPATGVASIFVTDLTADALVFARNVQLAPYSGPLYPAAGAAEAAEGALQSAARPIASVTSLDVEPGVVPVRVSWWILQRPAPDQPYLSVQQIDRRRETVFNLHLPWEVPVGELGLSLRDARGAEVLYVPYAFGAEYTPIPASLLEAGPYTALLTYTDGERQWELAQRELVVGALTVDVAYLNARRTDRNTIALEGALNVAADGPLGEVTVGLDATVVHHAFAYNPQTGQASFRAEAAEPLTVFGPLNLLVEDTAQLAFSAELPVPGAGDPRALWEIRVEPFSYPEGFFAAGASYTTWVGQPPARDAWQGFLQNERVTRRQLAPGVEVVSLSGRIPAGPLEMHLVIADLTEPGVYVDALVGGTLYTPASSRWPRSVVSEMVRAYGAVAGVNAAFFDIGDSMNPLGIVMRSGDLLKTEVGGFEAAIGIAADGAPYLGYWRWTGGVQRPDGSAYRPVQGLNVTTPGTGLTLYRPPASRTVGTTDPNTPIVELILRELPGGQPSAAPWDPADARALRGVVEEIRVGGPATPLGPGMMVLAGGGENGQYLLNTFAVGDVVEVVYRLTGRTEWPYLDDWKDLRAAVSGGTVLLRNGSYGDATVTTNKERHPRTAVGISWDQTRLYVLVVDGRSVASVGMTYQEMADFFRYVGAFHALNLDGGGSTALAVRDPDLGDVTVLNVPSDGRERYVPDGLGIFYAPPTAERAAGE